MFKKPDYEYRAQFVPGVGSLRPFQRPARAIPPTKSPFPPEVTTLHASGTRRFYVANLGGRRARAAAV